MLAHARSEEIQEYGHSRFYFCPVCQAVFTPNDFGVETVMGRPFHVVHFTTDQGEAWERHPLRPIAQGPVATQPE
jgi:hypothetical protein